MSNTVDARGLACPQPVILAKKSLKQFKDVTVIVDNETAQRNVTLAAGKQGADVDVETKDDGIYLYLKKTGLEVPAAAAGNEKTPALSAGMAAATAVVIPADTMGRGSEELGGILIRGFFHALCEQETLPEAVIFFNSGVKLVCKGSEVLDDLRKLHDSGVRILACGTCLEYFNCKDDIAVGDISNMYSIVETMTECGKIIEL